MQFVSNVGFIYQPLPFITNRYIKGYQNQPAMSTQTPQIKATAVFGKASLDTCRNTVDSVIDATEKSVKYFDDSIHAFAQFNTNQIETWFATFKNVKN